MAAYARQQLILWNAMRGISGACSPMLEVSGPDYFGSHASFEEVI